MLVAYVKILGMLAAYVKILARDVGSLHVIYWLGMLAAYVKILARDVGSLHVKYWLGRDVDTKKVSRLTTLIVTSITEGCWMSLNHMASSFMGQI